MPTDRPTDDFSRGAALLASLSPPEMAPPWESFADVAPFLGCTVGSAFGSVISRPGLDLRTREIITVSVLATLGGCDAQVSFHVRAALRAGATAPEIVEAITQVSVYAGIPRALNAVAAARPAFAAAGVDGAVDSPRAVVMLFIDAVARGDRDAVMGLLAEDIAWAVPGGSQPIGGTWNGRDDVAAWETALRTMVDIESVTAGDPLSAGNTLYVPISFTVRQRETHAPVAGQLILEVHVSDGRITAGRIHGDLLAVVAETPALLTQVS